ncbi:hypothetical protein [Streptomyces pseudovenezuelae]|uniref:DNA-directed RNA polymerase specialized sigma24 family protein n=1 Tax=Streptomyces pseudovenezuelae TaxID=67350 RepID=A0ABT6LYD3_9ACTN|nr:hypothetical protein [Streptomyces pseudovenezuelae]MDH6220870.1 hypothetical protein [Streptomyces pseudovenezuelae]
MHLRSRRRPSAGTRPPFLEVESLLVEQYGELVRLAHLVLPATIGRHRRVLVAHSLVQRALTGVRALPGHAVPPPRAEKRGGDPVERSLLLEVLRGSLSYGRGPRLWPARFASQGTLLPGLPLVVGLRLFPRSGGADELALAQRLSGVPAAARAAFLLRSVHGMSDDAVHQLLSDAGARDPDAALRTADALDESVGTRAAALLTSLEFDACALQASPTDLLRRRRRARLGLAALALLAVTGVTLAATTSGGTTSQAEAPASAAGSALRPAELVRTPAGVWDHTPRVDFTAWPARGARVHDDDLLGRALTAWTRPARRTHVTLAPGTTAAVPTSAPQLLYAGDVDDRAVVLLYDGQRLARYDEFGSSGERAELSVARADDADVTTAAAVALGPSEQGRSAVRYLLAPWVAEAQTRDLLRPDVLARPLTVSKEGVTGPVATVAAGRGCAGRPALQLRSSSRVAEHHAFLLAGLGDLSPVHLTYTPLPGHGTPPARQPREATGPAALLAWTHQACGLGSLRGTGVRAVNAWDFAEQELPEGGGHAVWTCARADSWRGPGDVTVTLRTSRDAQAAPARTVAGATSTAACSRFGQHVVAATGWRSPRGHWFVVAAGSRAVTRLSVTGAVSATKEGRTLALPAPGKPRVGVRARLATGGSLDAVGSR